MKYINTIAVLPLFLSGCATPENPYSRETSDRPIDDNDRLIRLQILKYKYEHTNLIPDRRDLVEAIFEEVKHLGEENLPLDLKVFVDSLR